MSTHNRTLIEQRDNVAIYRDGPAAYAAFQRISWGAIFAGAVVSLAMLTLLNLLGLSIGFATINPTQEADPLGGIGIGSLVWLGISSLLALYAGGWVAGRLAGYPKKSTAMIHGVITWAVFTIFSIYFASSAVGSLFNAVGNTLSRTASLAASGISSAGGAVASNNDGDESQTFNMTLEDVKREAMTLLEQAGDPSLDPNRLNNSAENAAQQGKQAANQAFRNPQEANKIISDYLGSLANQASNMASNVDKGDVAAIIAERRNMSEAQAMEIVNGWDRRLGNAAEQVSQYAQNVQQNVRERTPEIAENVAGALAKVAFYSFLALLLGAVAAAFGGLSGRQLDEAVIGDQSLAAGDV